MNTVLFDLDGTLLPMDVEEFTKNYFGYIVQTMNENGRDGKFILKAIGKGVEEIVKNNGTLTNEEVFWNTFTSITNIKQEEIEPEFTKFYETRFDFINTGRQSIHMIQAVSLLKEKGYRLVLATNPLFPSIATGKRIKWAGLNKEDFEWVTTYENSSYAKPNPSYYKEIIDKLKLDVTQCLMVGNDVKEDCAINSLGIPVYLVNDYLLNKYNLEITCPCTSSLEFLEYVKNLPNIK